MVCLSRLLLCVHCHTEQQFETVQALFQKNTFTAILLAAFTPIPFKVFTVMGGVLQAPLIPFLLGAIIGRSMRYYTLGLLFFIFGEKIRVYIERHFERVTLILGIVLIIGYHLLLFAMIYYLFKHMHLAFVKTCLLDKEVETMSYLPLFGLKEKQNPRFIIVPIPWEGTVSYNTGTSCRPSVFI